MTDRSTEGHQAYEDDGYATGDFLRDPRPPAGFRPFDTMVSASPIIEEPTRPDQDFDDPDLFPVTQGMVIEGSVVPGGRTRTDPRIEDTGVLTGIHDPRTPMITFSRYAPPRAPRRAGQHAAGGGVLDHPWVQAGTRYLNDLLKPRRDIGRTPNLVALLSGAALLVTALIAALTGVTVTSNSNDADGNHPPTTYEPDQPGGTRSTDGGLSVQQVPPAGASSVTSTPPLSLTDEPAPSSGSGGPTRLPPANTPASTPQLARDINDLVARMLREQGLKYGAPQPPTSQSTTVKESKPAPQPAPESSDQGDS